MVQSKISSRSHADNVKKDSLAVAVLLDVAYHIKRKTSELKKDLKLKKNEYAIIQRLNKSGYLRPNPQITEDTKYVLAPKGYFLINELKTENPELLKNIEPKLIPQ